MLRFFFGGGEHDLFFPKQVDRGGSTSQVLGGGVFYLSWCVAVVLGGVKGEESWYRMCLLSYVVPVLVLLVESLFFLSLVVVM